jgi:mannose-6-phosphate isomerase-like protein (cupin superfamily)
MNGDTSGYTVLSLNELESYPYHGREGQQLLTVERLLGFRPAGVNAWIGDPGDSLVPEHDEDSDEELYVVVQGRATFTVDGRTVDAPAGTLVHVTAQETRTAVSAELRTIVLAVGGTPGVAHVSHGWPSWTAADALRRQGRLEEARAILRETLELAAGAWYVHYNAACFEALAGDADSAFRHLERARSLDADAVRGQAAEDPDLASLHEDARWQEVTR